MRRLVLAPLIVRAVSLGMPAPSSPQPYGSVPLDLLLDVCVLPADDCGPTHDVMTLSVDGKPLEVGVLRTEILTGGPGAGAVQTELTLRPMRAVGPADLLKQLTPGARLRMRASTRMADRMMLVSSVEPSKKK